MNKKNLLPFSLLLGTLSVHAEKAPNVIIILADDMGYGDVSYLNENSKINTQCLDDMARAGVVFRDAHAAASVSTPSRYSLLTGRYSWRSSHLRSALSGYSAPIIPTDRETLASMLKKQGYQTACIGKWHLGWNWANMEKGADNVNFALPIQNGPTTRGFDYFYGISASLDMAPYVYVENDKVTALPDRTTQSPLPAFWRKGPTGSDFDHADCLPNLTRRAVEYIHTHAGQKEPYFLYLPLPAPHTPILPSKEFKGKSGIGDYGDFVMMVDDVVGQIRKAVKSNKKAGGNTIIIFASDNGYASYAQPELLRQHGHYPSYIFRGYKFDLFDGGHRIPLIIECPDQKHQDIDSTVSLTDIYATLANLSGHHMTAGEGEDSYNLMPMIRNPRNPEVFREATVFLSTEACFAIRQNQWKLLLTPTSGGGSYPTAKDIKGMTGYPKIQLYRMDIDPGEKNNVEAEYPEVVKKLYALLEEYIKSGRSTPGAKQRNSHPEEVIRNLIQKP